MNGWSGVRGAHVALRVEVVKQHGQGLVKDQENVLGWPRKASIVGLRHVRVRKKAYGIAQEKFFCTTPLCLSQEFGLLGLNGANAARRVGKVIRNGPDHVKDSAYASAAQATKNGATRSFVPVSNL